MRRNGPMARDGRFEVQQSPRTELARILLAVADPIRLRMLNLLLAGELSPEQISRVLGVQEKIIVRHLVLFREGKMVAMRTNRNVKFYTVRSDPEFTPIPLLRLAVEMIEHDSVLKMDLAVFDAGRQDNQQCDRAVEAQSPNSIGELRPGL